MASGNDPAALLTPGTLTDPSLLAQALRIYRSGDADACLRARRFLDAAARNTGEPSAESMTYAQATARLDAAGQPRHAEFLRELTRITPALAEAAQQWRHRYNGRPGLHHEDDDGHRQSGASWDEPYAGLDGMLYTPGLCHVCGYDLPVVRVHGRGARELITGFGSLDAALDWVRDDRCTTQPRPFTPPPGRLLPRVMQEERILSALLTRPGHLPGCFDWLPATTFTTDLRYEIFAALDHTHHSPLNKIACDPGHPNIGQITRETLRRLAWSPDWDNPHLGGPGTPLATAYLHRLTLTTVTTQEAARTAKNLIWQDGGPTLDQGEERACAAPPKVGASTPAHRPLRLLPPPAAQPQRDQVPRM
jgi:hypothetical protein